MRIEVQNGVATFSGAITNERRDGLKVIAENTPGCVAVHDHMAWIEPNSGVVIPSAGDDPSARAASASYSATAPWSAGGSASDGVPNPGAGSPKSDAESFSAFAGSAVVCLEVP